MHDPIAASRRTALRAVFIQAAVGLLVALVFLAVDPAHALSAGMGALAMVLGNAVGVHVALNGIVPAKVALVRLLMAVMAKWIVAIVVFAIALVVWRLPPLPMLVGLVVGLLTYLLALNVSATGRKQKG